MVAVLESLDQTTQPPQLRLLESPEALEARCVSAVTYRRRRLAAFAVVAAMVWLTVSTAITLASWAGGIGAPVFVETGEPVVHVVGSGDTVWSVAREFQPDGDVRPFVDRIVAMNGGSDLFIGQQLVLAR